jgi:hypothetical protein
MRATWDAGVPFADYLRRETEGLDADSLAVLRALAAGLTDEAGARRVIAASSPAPNTLPPTRGAGPAQAEVFHVTPARTLAVSLPAPRDDGHDAAATPPIVPMVPAVSPTVLTVTDPPRPER